jgi:hypothetical protein
MACANPCGGAPRVVLLRPTALSISAAPSAGWTLLGLLLPALIAAAILVAWYTRRSGFPRHMKEGSPGELAMLRTVDIALYAAKAEGRNRCKLAVPPALE